MKVAAQKKVKNRPILPERGNILSSDGRLLSGNLPEYEVKIDFSVCRQFRDTCRRVTTRIARVGL